MAAEANQQHNDAGLAQHRYFTIAKGMLDRTHGELDGRSQVLSAGLWLAPTVDVSEPHAIAVLLRNAGHVWVAVLSGSAGHLVCEGTAFGISWDVEIGQIAVLAAPGDDLSLHTVEDRSRFWGMRLGSNFPFEFLQPHGLWIRLGTLDGSLHLVNFQFSHEVRRHLHCCSPHQHASRPNRCVL